MNLNGTRLYPHRLVIHKYMYIHVYTCIYTTQKVPIIAHAELPHMNNLRQESVHVQAWDFTTLQHLLRQLKVYSSLPHKRTRQGTCMYTLPETSAKVYRTWCIPVYSVQCLLPIQHEQSTVSRSSQVRLYVPTQTSHTHTHTRIPH